MCRACSSSLYQFLILGSSLGKQLYIWLTIASSGYPLSRHFSNWIGVAVWALTLPLLYYTNAWDAKRCPYMSSDLFREDGSSWEAATVLNNLVIDMGKLYDYGLPRITASSIWSYFTQNLVSILDVLRLPCPFTNSISLSQAVDALISHTIIFYSRPIAQSIKRARSGTVSDPHARIVLKGYKETPMSWYIGLFVLSFMSGIIVNAKGRTTLPG